jgi:23S rRNA (cytidine1920-2'-O)/16S rRNA (cytidine1409-2'-O)-methyltransferase
VALDVGSGAGGFTWLLLRHGARRVFAVDVGSDQLSEKLRADPRVAVYEQTDVRDLTSLPDPPHIALVDVSFISLRAVLPHVCTLTRADADLVVLLKPQFELGSVALQKGETVRKAHTQGRIRDAFIAWCPAHNLAVRGVFESPLPGKHGDRELFLHLKPV